MARAGALLFHRLDGAGDGFDVHHQSHAAAEGIVVHLFVLVERVIPEIVDVNIHDPVFPARGSAGFRRTGR